MFGFLMFGDFEVSSADKMADGVYRVTVLFQDEYYMFDARASTPDAARRIAIDELEAHLHNALTELRVYKRERGYNDV